MSSTNIIPILSSSPPPLNDTLSEDQAFGDFEVADDDYVQSENVHNEFYSHEGEPSIGDQVEVCELSSQNLDDNYLHEEKELNCSSSSVVSESLNRNSISEESNKSRILTDSAVEVNHSCSENIEINSKRLNVINEKNCTLSENSVYKNQVISDVHNIDCSIGHKSKEVIKLDHHNGNVNDNLNNSANDCSIENSNSLPVLSDDYSINLHDVQENFSKKQSTDELCIENSILLSKNNLNECKDSTESVEIDLNSETCNSSVNEIDNLKDNESNDTIKENFTDNLDIRSQVNFDSAQKIGKSIHETLNNSEIAHFSFKQSDDDYGEFEKTDTNIEDERVNEKDDFGDFATSSSEQFSNTCDLELSMESSKEDFCNTSDNTMHHEHADDNQCVEYTSTTCDGNQHISRLGEKAIDEVNNDFGDFSSNLDKSDCIESVLENVDDSNEDFADFGDFEGEKPNDWAFQSSNDRIEEVSGNNMESDSYDFQFAQTNEDFGDFNAFESNDTDNWAFQSNDAKLEKVEYETSSGDDIVALLKNAFPVMNLKRLAEESYSENKLECCKLEDSYLLKALKSSDESESLKIEWSCLKSNEFLLKALEIDSRNILFGQSRNPSIPIFATGLGLLEPMKSVDVLVKKSSQEINSNNLIDEQTEDLSSPVKNEVIPPVQFDWSVSGLTNPLESLSTSSSILLDVDSFSKNSSNIPSTSSKSSSLEDEFLSSPSPEHGPSTSSVLDKLMSSVKKSTYIPQGATVKRPPGLSNEAIEILNKLVSLSFMSAKVLMFPISEKSTEN